uniref:Protein takeout n=1 Tax=Timema cristinae TaxID=61476 RepID=A0A7R9D9N0_TIMCR|nr:unnamed protein product [Timema cristinae]
MLSPASYIEICSRNDPNIENCIINSIEKVRPKLLTGIMLCPCPAGIMLCPCPAGIPELDVPPIEPLLLKEVVVSRGANAATFRAVGSNVKVYGPAQFQITGLKVDLKNMVFYINLKLPELYFDGDYDVNARILILPLRGKGPIKANATDCSADVVLRGQVYKKKGEDYLRFQSIEIDLKIGKFHVHLDNLFGGDKVLGEATNAALNENRSEFIETLRPIAERTVGEVILEIANKITNNFSLKELFRDS